jgi:hypothetical protein
LTPPDFPLASQTVEPDATAGRAAETSSRPTLGRVLSPDEALSAPRRLFSDRSQKPTVAELKRASAWYASWLAKRYPGTVWEDVTNVREPVAAE